jgi:hypothetical protein
MTVSFALLLPSQEFFLVKKLTNLKIEGAASSGGQGKLTYLMYVSFRSRQDSQLTFCFLFKRDRKFCFLFTFASDPFISEINYSAFSISKYNS